MLSHLIISSLSQSTISSHLSSHLNNHLGDDGRRRDKIERDSEIRIGNERDNLHPDDKFLFMIWDVRLWEMMIILYFMISHNLLYLTIYHLTISPHNKINEWWCETSNSKRHRHKSTLETIWNDEMVSCERQIIDDMVSCDTDNWWDGRLWDR